MFSAGGTMQTQAHYFLSPVLVYDGSELKVAMTRALVSHSGVYKVFEESEEVHRAFLAGKQFKIRLDGVDFRARLVRESGPSGTHYNLRMVQPEQARQNHLRSLLDRYGFASPWKRDFARIPSSLVFRQVEAPVRAVVLRFSGEAPGDVRNFSYHGIFLQLQCACPSMGEVVGQKVRFRIETSKGRMLEEASARIARIYDEMVNPGNLQRGLGLRILDMPESARRVYHAMILESCKELTSDKGG
jgi:hypothetical protein